MTLDPAALPAPRPDPRRLALPLLLLALVLLQALLRPPRPAADDPLRRLEAAAAPDVVLQGRLLEDPRPFAGAACGVLLQLEAGGGSPPLRGRSELILPRCQELRQGWRVRAVGSLGRPAPAPHPLLGGSAERLARRGVWTRLRVERLEVLARPASPVADLRRHIAARFTAVAGARRGGLLAALVLGGAMAPLPVEVREAFRAAGLSHALAASGFHLSVLLGAVLACGRGMGAAVRLALGGGAMALFLLLAGAQPSVVRAVLMGAVGLVAVESGRRGRPLGILAATAALMLLLRPGWLREVGFQLSVAATAGLVVSARPLESWLAARLPGGGAERPGWLRRRLAPALAVPIAASLWTLPLQLLHFGAVPLYAVPANLLATPLLAPLTLAAMGLALVAVLLPPLLPLAAAPVGLLAGPLLALADAVAALPMAHWRTGRPLPLLVLLLAVGLLGWVLPGPGRRRRLGAALVALAMGLHLLALRGDQLLLVHQQGGGGRDLLLARHAGRGALVSSHADAASCRMAGRLAGGLGLQRLDWALLLDPVAPEGPACWGALAGMVVAYGEAGEPLRAGERLTSPGLAAEALSMDSHALELQFGRRRWLLLPDRQALWAWRQTAPQPERPRVDGLWLGFRPRAHERRRLAEAGAARVWLSGASSGATRLPAGWRSSGASGWLASP